jgi:hypothetical protein
MFKVQRLIRLRSAGAIVLDVIAILSLTGALAIAMGLSGRLYIGPWLVSATSSRNPLMIAGVALVIRSLHTETPLLGRVPLIRLPARALAMWLRIHEKLLNLTLDGGQRIVVSVMAVSLTLKLILAYMHPGFWTGDDVEIHEMTFARLFDHDWPIWNLRSPFYPLVVIYPVQALLVYAGQTDPGWLVFAGRMVVATIATATLWLTFHVARRLFDSIPIALISVLILATNKLHTMTATTELPRPVASLLVLTAFTFVSVSGRPSATFSAGALIGAAAAMRFSEQVFILPMLVQLGLARRWKDMPALFVGFTAVAIVVLGPIDALYWGEPFFSVRNIIDFTLTRRLSTRGYQPLYEYIRNIPEWTNLAVAALALLGSLKSRSVVLVAWTWIPVAILSLLPHKEPRYLVPILPYFSMLAGWALWRTIVSLRSGTEFSQSKRERRALLFAAIAVAVMMTEPTRYVLPRSDEAVAIARYIAGVDPPHGVAAQQVWSIGGRIYLPLANPLVDIGPDRMRSPEMFDAVLRTPGIQWLVLQDRDLRRSGYQTLITAADFEEVRTASPNRTFRLYRRR